ncbi:hypothetical protein SSYIS1_06590 [Serratia symbiotica]|uniref:Uncharacterized protein n=1 Tax=Serratia symbiotica TaxID=138074 RepID=A0A455VEP0_9GAMM|nr:hypothetical protein SSYIS1_06590 [Serratia symbiotica]
MICSFNSAKVRFIQQSHMNGYSVKKERNYRYISMPKVG